MKIKIKPVKSKNKPKRIAHITLPPIQKEKELQSLLAQAEYIIKRSEVKTGRNHPIFYYQKSIGSKLFYSRLFDLNAGKELYCMDEVMNDFMCNSRDFFYSFEMDECKSTEINLSNTFVFSLPWERGRFVSTLSGICSSNGNPFAYMKNNHYSILLKPLGIVIVHNGYHSITSGIIHSEGMIRTTSELDISVLYERYFFDGTYMCDQITKERIHKVKHYEVGVMFEVGRLIKQAGIEFY